MARKSIRASKKSGEKRDRKGRRWARNGETARYCGVSDMTLWRWKHDPHYNFPVAAEVNGLEFNDLDKVDVWIEAGVPKKGAER